MIVDHEELMKWARQLSRFPVKIVIDSVWVRAYRVFDDHFLGMKKL